MTNKGKFLNNLALFLLILVIGGLLFTINSKYNEIDDLKKELKHTDSIYFKMILEEDTIIRQKNKDIDSLMRINLAIKYNNDSLIGIISYLDRRMSENRTKFEEKLKAIDTLNVNNQLKYFKDNLYKN